MKKTYFLFIAALLSAIAGCYSLATRTETALENDHGASCDVSLWVHVYHGRFRSAEDRLQVINPCLTVSGFIVNARRSHPVSAPCTPENG